jgi:guanine nucleotide-binding protein subunit alpha
VWADTVNSEYIAGKKPIVLFLNKVDLFQQKLRRSPLRKVPAFKSYKGGDDVEKGIQFIISLYAKQVKSQEVAKSIFPHAVCAIDTENVRRIFSSVRDFIFRARMQASGL